jgi:hypothetical protein
VKGEAVLGRCSVSHAFVDDTLACGDDSTFVAQAGEGYGDLLLVATADAIGNDKDLVASSQQINGGLCDADVALDADNNAGEGPCGLERVDGLLYFWGAEQRQQRVVWARGGGGTSWKTKSCLGGSGSGHHPGRRGAARDMCRPGGRGSGWLRRRGC